MTSRSPGNKAFHKAWARFLAAHAAKEWDAAEAALEEMKTHNPLTYVMLRPLLELGRGEPILICSCSNAWPCTESRPGPHEPVAVMTPDELDP